MKNAILLTIFLGSLNAFAQSPCPQLNDRSIYVVQPGDDWTFIAREFDLTVRDLKEWNGFKDGDVLEPCTPLIIKGTPGKQRARVVKQNGEVHVVRTGERIADIARTYGYTEEKFREFNSLGETEEPNTGAVLWNTHCNCAAVRTASTAKPGRDDVRDYSDDFDDKERKLVSEQEGGRRETQKSSLSKAFSKTTMSKEEGDMINEINLLRSDPKAYVRFVEAWQKDHSQQQTKVVRELIEELKSTPRLGLLQPEECLYTAAKKHAKDQKPGGDISHQSTDGRWPWQRIVRECGKAEDGGENVLNCPASIREGIIMLLIDSGNSDRHNRKNLLDPNWKFVACHKVGKVGRQEHVWIQEFAH